MRTLVRITAAVVDIIVAVPCWLKNGHGYVSGPSPTIIVTSMLALRSDDTVYTM